MSSIAKQHRLHAACTCTERLVCAPAAGSSADALPCPTRELLIDVSDPSLLTVTHRNGNQG